MKNPDKSPIDIVVTAGPTREKIDPVRFISNFSTGVFGYEIAREASRRGHDVVLISGPVALKPPRKVRIINVESSAEMLKAVKRSVRKGGCLVMTAAVSDFKPISANPSKIKKRKIMSLKLTETIDILKSLKKTSDVFKIGFSLESYDLKKKALAKLKDKNLDIIVGNMTGGSVSPFGEGKKNFIIISKNGKHREFCSVSKKDMAKVIVKMAEEAFYG